MMRSMDTETAEAIVFLKFVIELATMERGLNPSEFQESSRQLIASEPEIKRMLDRVKLPHSIFYKVWQWAANRYNKGRKYLEPSVNKVGIKKTRMIGINYGEFKAEPLGISLGLTAKGALSRKKLPSGLTQIRALLRYKESKAPKKKRSAKGSSGASPSRDQEILDFIEQFKRRGVYRSDIEKRFGPCRDVLISLKRSGKIGIVGRRASTSDKDIFASGKYLRKKK